MKVALFIPVVLIAVNSWLEFASGEPGWHFHARRRRRRRYQHCHGPVDCTVSQWCSWSHCSHPCGGKGEETRLRHVEKTQKCGGRCDHHLADSRPCNRFCHNGGWLYSNRNCICKTGFTGECCDKKKRGTFFLIKIEYLLTQYLHWIGMFERIQRML